MQCPLCEAENPETETHCFLCDSLLHEKEEAKVDENLIPKAEKKNWLFFSFFFLFCAIAIPWIMRLDLFRLPDEISQSSEVHRKLMKSYQSNEQYWRNEKEKLMSQLQQSVNHEPFLVSEISPEVIFSCLSDVISSSEATEFALDSTFFTSDQTVKESSIYFIKRIPFPCWPFYTIASLKIALRQGDNGVLMTVDAFRKGNRIEPKEEAELVFSKELEKAKQLERFLRGIVQIQSATLLQSNASLSSIPVAFSLTYLYHPVQMEQEELLNSFT